ncbi:MAG: hypothetical protein ACKPKO_09910, partial [Candidatus Fonsibacter sp.]
FFTPAYPDNSDATSRLNKLNLGGDFDFYMQICSKLFPEQRIRSHAEGMRQLKKCLGLASSPVHIFDISGMEYRTSKFILRIDCEKLIGATWTGLNTRGGDLLTGFKKLCRD